MHSFYSNLIEILLSPGGRNSRSADFPFWFAFTVSLSKSIRHGLLERSIPVGE
jgi:hypothetical protein